MSSKLTASSADRSAKVRGLVVVLILIASLCAAIAPSTTADVKSQGSLTLGKEGPSVAPGIVGGIINFSLMVGNPDSKSWTGDVYDIPPGGDPGDFTNKIGWTKLTAMPITLPARSPLSTWYYDYTITAADVAAGTVRNHMAAIGKHADGYWSNGTVTYTTTLELPMCPTAIAHADPSCYEYGGSDITFDGSDSYAVDPQTIVMWQWTFSDGQCGSDDNFAVTARWVNETITATLTVVDSLGCEDTTYVQISPCSFPYSFSLSGNFSELWNESFTNEPVIVVIPDLNGDTNSDVLIYMPYAVSNTTLSCEKMVIKSGYDGTILWEDTICSDQTDLSLFGFGLDPYYSPFNSPLYPYLNNTDLDGDGLNDGIMRIRKYDKNIDTTTELVIAKKGSDGTTLWEVSESASGGDTCGIAIIGFGCFCDPSYYLSLDHPYYPHLNHTDLDGDGLDDGFVLISKYNATTRITTERIIAKKGSDGTTLWEESVSAAAGDSCTIDIAGFGCRWSHELDVIHPDFAKDYPDFDGDGLDDGFVLISKYNAT
ncbi:MAG: hypothetical protein ACP5E9_10750, partial [Candidatus Methanospirareceae archaeon]